MDIVQHGHNKDRDDQNAKDGNLVRNGHFNPGAIPEGVPPEYGNGGGARFLHHLCHC